MRHEARKAVTRDRGVVGDVERAARDRERARTRAVGQMGLPGERLRVEADDVAVRVGDESAAGGNAEVELIRPRGRAVRDRRQLLPARLAAAAEDDDRADGG